MKLLVKRISVAIVLCICLVTSAFAQHDFKKIDAWLDQYTPQMGGRSILMIYHDGQLVYSRAVNQITEQQKMVQRFIARQQGKTADLSDYTPAMRQPIASCSKWLSAALVMTFIDEGKLSLTDTIGKYLPVLSKGGKSRITVAQCLSHLTAIKEGSLSESLADLKNDRNMDDAMADLAKLPMEGEPGKVFHYSNAGLQIAGAIIEKISGKSFETLFAERIAQPLQLKNTDFGKGRVALPAGGASSTPEDYLNFLVMIMNHGTFNGKRILSEKSIREMQVNRLTPDVKIAYSPGEAAALGYGFGEWVMNNKTVSSPGLFGSFPWVDNDHQYAAFLMTFYLKNTGRGERYKELKQLVDEALAK